MSKLNKSGAAKKASQSKQLINGASCIGSHSSHIESAGKFTTPYEQGVQAYINMTPYSQLWHPHMQQGWNKEALVEMKQLKLCTCSIRAGKIAARLAMYYAKNEAKRAA